MFFAPCHQYGWVLGVPPSRIMSNQPPSPKGEGAEVSKMAIRVWAGGYPHGEGGVCGGVCLSVCPSVCLSVTGRTSPSCLDQSPRNFRWWSGSMSGTFISGTGPIGQGTAEKRAGNSNLSRFTLKKGGCFGQFYGLVWFPGGAPCNLVVPGGH